MTIAILIVYAVLIGLLLRHAWVNFGKEVFSIMVGVLLFLSLVALARYEYLL